VKRRPVAAKRSILGFDGRRAVAAEVAVTQVVRQNDDDVRTGGFWPADRRSVEAPKRLPALNGRIAPVRIAMGRKVGSRVVERLTGKPAGRRSIWNVHAKAKLS